MDQVVAPQKVSYDFLSSNEDIYVLETLLGSMPIETHTINTIQLQVPKLCFIPRLDKPTQKPVILDGGSPISIMPITAINDVHIVKSTPARVNLTGFQGNDSYLSTRIFTVKFHLKIKSGGHKHLPIECDFHEGPPMSKLLLGRNFYNLMKLKDLNGEIFLSYKGTHYEALRVDQHPLSPCPIPTQPSDRPPVFPLKLPHKTILNMGETKEFYVSHPALIHTKDYVIFPPDSLDKLILILSSVQTANAKLALFISVSNTGSLLQTLQKDSIIAQCQELSSYIDDQNTIINYLTSSLLDNEPPNVDIHFVSKTTANPINPSDSSTSYQSQLHSNQAANSVQPINESSQVLDSPNDINQSTSATMHSSDSIYHSSIQAYSSIPIPSINESSLHSLNGLKQSMDISINSNINLAQTHVNKSIHQTQPLPQLQPSSLPLNTNTSTNKNINNNFMKCTTQDRAESQADCTNVTNMTVRGSDIMHAKNCRDTLHHDADKGDLGSIADNGDLGSITPLPKLMPNLQGVTEQDLGPNFSQIPQADINWLKAKNERISLDPTLRNLNTCDIPVDKILHSQHEIPKINTAAQVPKLDQLFASFKTILPQDLTVRTCAHCAHPSFEIPPWATDLDYAPQDEHVKAWFNHLLWHFAPTFVEFSKSLGRCDAFPMTFEYISQQGSTHSRPYPLIPGSSQEIFMRKTIARFCAENILRKITSFQNMSRYTCPALLVKKANHTDDNPSYRLICDLRHMNSDIVPSPQVVRDFHTILHAIGAQPVKSQLDFADFFFQLPLHEDRIHDCIMITPWGSRYGYNVSPQGLKTSSSHAQLTSDLIFADLPNSFIIVDDLATSTATELTMLHHIEIILWRCATVNLRLKMKKCAFFKPDLHLLGFYLNEHGSRVSDGIRHKLRQLRHFVPRTVKHVKSLQGILSWCRKHFPPLARKIKPITDLLQGIHYPNSIKNMWSPHHAAILTQVIDEICDKGYIAHIDPDENNPLLFWTDANDNVISYIAAQKKYCPTTKKFRTFLVGCNSRVIKKGEIPLNHISAKEALALTWCLSQYRPYLIGSRKCLVFCDNVAVCSALKKAYCPNGGKLADLIAQCQDLDLMISHLPSEANPSDIIGKLSQDSNDLLLIPLHLYHVGPDDSKISGQRSLKKFCQITPVLYGADLEKLALKSDSRSAKSYTGDSQLNPMANSFHPKKIPKSVSLVHHDSLYQTKPTLDNVHTAANVNNLLPTTVTNNDSNINPSHDCIPDIVSHTCNMQLTAHDDISTTSTNNKNVSMATHTPYDGDCMPVSVDPYDMQLPESTTPTANNSRSPANVINNGPTAKPTCDTPDGPTNDLNAPADSQTTMDALGWEAMHRPNGTDIHKKIMAVPLVSDTLSMHRDFANPDSGYHINLAVPPQNTVTGLTDTVHETQTGFCNPRLSETANSTLSHPESATHCNIAPAYHLTHTIPAQMTHYENEYKIPEFQKTCDWCNLPATTTNHHTVSCTCHHKTWTNDVHIHAILPNPDNSQQDLLTPATPPQISIERPHTGFYPNIPLIHDLQLDIRAALAPLQPDVEKVYKERIFKLSNDVVMIKNKSTDSFKTFVPKTFLLNWLKDIHNPDNSSPHFGIAATTELFQQTMDTFHAKNIIHDFVVTCHSCQLYKRYAPMLHPKCGDTLIASDRNQIMSMDISGPHFGKRLGGSAIYHFGIIDNFSRYLWSYFYTKNPTAEDLATSLSDLFAMVGAPMLLVSDGAKVNTAQPMTALAAKLRLYKIITPAHTSRSNGLIERVFRTHHNIMRVLAQNLPHDPQRYIESLKFATASYNATYHSVIKCSPFFAYYTRQSNLFQPLHKFQSKTAPNMHRFLKQAEADQYDVQQNVTQQMTKYKEKMKEDFDKRLKQPIDISVGEPVLVYFPSTNKFSCLFIGPAIILDLKPPVALIEFLSNQRRMLIHLSRVKPYKYRSNQLKYFTGPSSRVSGLTTVDKIREFYNQNIISQDYRNPYFMDLFKPQSMSDSPHQDSQNLDSQTINDNDNDDENMVNGDDMLDDDDNDIVDNTLTPSPLRDSFELDVDKAKKQVRFASQTESDTDTITQPIPDLPLPRRSTRRTKYMGPY